MRLARWACRARLRAAVRHPLAAQTPERVRTNSRPLRLVWKPGLSGPTAGINPARLLSLKLRPAAARECPAAYRVPQAYVILTMSRYMKVSVDLTPSISRMRWTRSSRWRLSSQTTSTSKS